MKKGFYLLIVTLLFLSTSALAQRIIVGERAPELKIKEWDQDRKPNLQGQAQLIHFFMSTNKQCIAILETADADAEKYAKKLNVLIISREPAEKTKAIFSAKKYKFFIGYDDDGKSFNSFNIKFVPYSVLIDSRGNVAWSGNPANLTDEIIAKAIK